MELVLGPTFARGLVSVKVDGVIAIFGPTASGKSAVADAVAARLSGEVVSADAMQVYRDLPILTNQSPARLVGIWPLDHEASVGEYAELAQAAIDEILAAGRTPIVVGGTGLYLRAALAEIELPPAPEPGARERWLADLRRARARAGPRAPGRARSDRRLGGACKRPAPSCAGARAERDRQFARTREQPPLER